MRFSFQHNPPAVHTLLPSLLPHLDSCGIQALILILKKVLNCRYDIISLILLPSQVLLFFSCWGTENSQIVPNLENYGGWSISSKPHSRTAAIATTDLCAGAMFRWNNIPFVSFPGCLRNVSSTIFQSPEVLIQYEFIWKETMQLVSGKVEFNACQVSLLWHKSFLVSLWTFQTNRERALDKLWQVQTSPLCMNYTFGMKFIYIYYITPLFLFRIWINFHLYLMCYK